MAATTQKLTSFDRGTLILQGILAILFGIVAVFWPGLTIITLLYLFAAFLLIDGVVVMVRGFMNIRNFGAAILMILLGLLELGVGLYLFRNPTVTFATLILILGFTLIIRGLFAFVHAFTRKEDPSTIRTLNGILGALGVILGIVVLNQPAASGIAFVWILGLYALIAGPVTLAMSSDMANSNNGSSKKK